MDTRYISFGNVAEHVKEHVPPKSYESSIWNLGHALWDDLTKGIPDKCVKGPNKKHHVENMNRKMMVSDWLKGAVQAEVQQDVAAAEARGNASQVIIALLSGWQVEKACMYAARTKNFRLSMLLALLGSNGVGGLPVDSRKDIVKQILVWKQQKFINADGTATPQSLINTDMLRIYYLLSGQVELISHGLDWKRVFGLHLWYKSFSENTLKEVVQSYEAKVIRNPNPSRFPARLPNPVYSNKEVTSADPKDLLWHLLKIYCDSAYYLEQALLPNTHIAPNKVIISPKPIALLLILFRSYVQHLSHGIFGCCSVNEGYGIYEMRPAPTVSARSFVQNYNRWENGPGVFLCHCIAA